MTFRFLKVIHVPIFIPIALFIDMTFDFYIRRLLCTVHNGQTAAISLWRGREQPILVHPQSSLQTVRDMALLGVGVYKKYWYL